MPRLEFTAPVRVVVLASGTGSLLQALLDAAADAAYPAEIVAVGSDRPSAGALTRAEAAGVATFGVPISAYADRAAWDTALTAQVAAYHPDLVVSAGFMKLLGPAFLARYGLRAINTHPALLPSFPGMHAVADALDAGVRVTGSTVHFVDAGVDTGPIVAQEAVAVASDDDVTSLHERIKAVERTLLVDVVARLAASGCTVTGRKVSFG